MAATLVHTLEMNLASLNSLAAQGESERLEFKTTTGQRTEAMKTVCAMLNGFGGFVLFGVTDKGEVKGQDCTARTLEDIANELDRIEPPAFPDIETVSLENAKTVIALRINGGLGSGPYTYDGRPYLRQGPTTRVMPRDRYERLLIERMHGTRRWENLPVQGMRVQPRNPEGSKRLADGRAKTPPELSEGVTASRRDASLTGCDPCRGRGISAPHTGGGGLRRHPRLIAPIPPGCRIEVIPPGWSHSLENRCKGTDPDHT